MIYKDIARLKKASDRKFRISLNTDGILVDRIG